MALIENKSKDRLVLFKLRDASEHTRWKKGHMFKTMHNVNMDKLNMADTLDVKHFSKLITNNTTIIPLRLLSRFSGLCG